MAVMAEPRVCFVVTELLGIIPNGGIATATVHTALVLAQQGYRVDLFYCGVQDEMQLEWVDRYERAELRVRRLDRSQTAHPPFVADSYRLYQQLKHDAYDTIVFQDWQGLGYCSMVAKREGLAFTTTRLVHICHGPTNWLRQANSQLAVEGHELGYAHMERRSAELADVIVGPSRHLIDWMGQAGWNLPAQRHVIPYFTEAHTIDVHSRVQPAAERSDPLTELVFFGRLEERKGVRVLTGALNLLGPKLLDGVTVAFVGREATLTRADVTAMIDPDVRDRLGRLLFHGHFDQAQARAYLKQPGRVAIVPSYLDNSPNVVYECIDDRISFLASRAGGSGELVADADRESVLFDPSPASLAGLLGPLVAERRAPVPAMPSYSGDASLAAWRPLLEPAPPTTPATEASADDAPLVSVVVPHFNQPELIWPTLQSIADQDYPNLEIVLVDDGSTDAAAVENLSALEAHEWGRPFTLVRQENLYLGAARNTGARHAKGDLLAYVDDDDLISADYIRVLVCALHAFDADAVTVAIHGVEADDAGTIQPNADNATWVFFGDAPHLGTMINVFGGAAAMYRRAALDAVGGFFLHRDIGHEDWDLLARLNLAGHTVVSVPEPLYTYRVRPKSMLRTTPTWANMQPVFESYKQHLPEALRSWAELVRGQQEVIDELRASRGVAELERRAAVAALEQHQRYLAVLRRSLRTSGDESRGSSPGARDG
jgi:glycosyltransferase involved in cell wall biosynthesis